MKKISDTSKRETEFSEDQTPFRDKITIEDEDGRTMDYEVEALFDMNEQSYALLTSDDGIVLMKVQEGEGEEQYLVGIENPEEAEAILDAYQVAVEASPAE